MKHLRLNLRLPKTGYSRIIYWVLALLAAVFLVQLVMSLGWRMQFDQAIMHYVAYLINEHGFAPYRDIFEPNMPGTYLVHMAVGKLLGYSDLAIRMADITWLSATLTVSWFIMKPIGRVPALASCLLFGLLHLRMGSNGALQREFLAILPMAIALLIATRRKPYHSVKLIHFVTGVLFALAALVKPHLVIGLPALIIYNCVQESNDSKSARKFINTCITGSLLALLGLLLTLAIPLLWLGKIGAIQSFWEIFSSYLPLYAQMDSNAGFVEPVSRFRQYVLGYLSFGGFEVLLMSSIFGVYNVWTESRTVETRRLAVLLLSLTILYSIYAAIGGRFLFNHWIPYTYFGCLGTGLVLFSPPSMTNLRRARIVFPISIFLFTVMVTVEPAYDVIYLLRHGQPLLPSEGRGDEIAAYLNQHLSPTDRVQPLDWVQGTTRGMLFSKAIPATPYICDFQFYHHVSTPYIQGLRNDFMVKLEQTMPVFILDLHEKFKVTGIDTSYDFPELAEFIERHYREDYAGKGFTILKRYVSEEER